LSKGTGGDKLEYLFDLFDGNKSGCISVLMMHDMLNQIKVVAMALGREPGPVEVFRKVLVGLPDVEAHAEVKKMEWIHVGKKTQAMVDFLAGGDNGSQNAGKEVKKVRITRMSDMKM